MSRSMRKTPKIPVTMAKTDKPYKQAEHQRERSHVKASLKAAPDETKLPGGKAFGDPWKSEKDGHIYLGGKYERLAHAQRAIKARATTDKKIVARTLKKLIRK